MWVYLLDSSPATAEVTRLLMVQAQLGAEHYICTARGDWEAVWPPRLASDATPPQRILFLLDSALSPDLGEEVEAALMQVEQLFPGSQCLALTLVAPGRKRTLPPGICSFSGWRGELVKPVDTHLLRYIIQTRFAPSNLQPDPPQSGSSSFEA